jgi:hypothetical protein
VRRIAIVGFADTWEQCPFDEDILVYGVNELHKYLPRWDWWIEIHDRATLGLTKRGEDKAGEVDLHRRWLSAQRAGQDEKVIWMRDDIAPDFPAAEPFPLKEIQKTLGDKFMHGEPWTYFTSSVAFMMAHAITHGRDADLQPLGDRHFDSIELYGVDLAGEDEYVVQRPCVEVFIGIALGLGIKIRVAEGAGVLHGSHMYGFETHPAKEGAVNSAKVASRRRRLEKTLAELKNQAVIVKGALEETRNWQTILNGASRGMHVAPKGFLDEPQK